VEKYNHKNDLGLTNDIIEIDLAGKRGRSIGTGWR
jgi:hypothetical protein